MQADVSLPANLGEFAVLFQRSIFLLVHYWRFAILNRIVVANSELRLD